MTQIEKLKQDWERWEEERERLLGVLETGSARERRKAESLIGWLEQLQRWNEAERKKIGERIILGAFSSV